MHLALTSDFPSSPHHEVAARIQAAGRSPRAAWIGPPSWSRRIHFLRARAAFRRLGVNHLQCLEIDAAPAPERHNLLRHYDVVYLSGGDPLLFRQQLIRTGLATRLREFAEAGRFVVGASGGAMQLTMNVSIFRLLAAPIEKVVAARGDFAGLGLAGCEVLPHLNKHDALFTEKVRRYSELIPHDVLAIDDGAALIFDGDGGYRLAGDGVRYRHGVRTAIDPADIAT